MRKSLLIVLAVLLFAGIANAQSMRITSAFVDAAGRAYTLAMPYLYGISEDDVTGHQSFVKVGYQPASDTARRAIWNVAADYVFPTSAQQMEVVSSDANDTSNGTGARTVKIYYLTDTFVEKTEIVTLNGTSVVPTTATDIYRINNFRVMTTGTNKAPVGVITLRNLADTPIYDQIAAGYNASRTLVFTVPKDKVIYAATTQFSAGYSTAGKQVLFTTLTSYDSIEGAQTTGGFLIPYSEYTLQDQAISMDLLIPTKLPEGTDVKFVVAGQTNSVCSATVRGWIENE